MHLPDSGRHSLIGTPGQDRAFIFDGHVHGLGGEDLLRPALVQVFIRVALLIFLSLRGRRPLSLGVVVCVVCLALLEGAAVAGALLQVAGDAPNCLKLATATAPLAILTAITFLSARNFEFFIGVLSALYLDY